MCVEGGGLERQIHLMGEVARRASRKLGLLTTSEKNSILREMAIEIDKSRRAILSENRDDVSEATQSGLTPALLDRLTLDDKRIDSIVEAITEVCALQDPVGDILESKATASGLSIEKVRVPIGVIAIIYEARPNVTADSAVLCLKSGNAVILRSGREARRSAAAITAALNRGGKRAGLPDGAIQLVLSTDREAVKHLVQLVDYVDLVIPRGGESLIRAVTEMAHVPVIKHYKGVCHIFVDQSADLDRAIDIVENAKCQRPGVCNALETLLVHESIAELFLPKLADRLQSKGVELRGDEMARRIVNRVMPRMSLATESDWSEEYLDLILSVRVVPSLQDAIEHINHYGSHHSDSILSSSSKNQEQFLKEVDSAAVYVNTSTRFTDGGQFGFGMEIGISTDKLHARGPMGIDELTTYKYQIRSDWCVRD